MSTVKTLKDVLDQSYTTFKRNKAALAHAILTNNPRTIRLKQDQLEESVEALNTCHTSWVSKAEFDDTALSAERFTNKWIENIWQETDELCEAASNIVALDEVPSETPILSLEAQLLILEKQMESLQSNIANELDALCSRTSVENIPSASRAIFTEMKSKVAAQLETPYRELSQSITALSSTETARVINEHETFRQMQHKRLVDIQVNLASLANDTSTYLHLHRVCQHLLLHIPVALLTMRREKHPPSMAIQ